MIASEEQEEQSGRDDHDEGGSGSSGGAGAPSRSRRSSFQERLSTSRGGVQSKVSLSFLPRGDMCACTSLLLPLLSFAAACTIIYPLLRTPQLYGGSGNSGSITAVHQATSNTHTY